MNEYIKNSIGIKLVLIKNGTFLMGTPFVHEGYSGNEIQHEVKISKNYYIGAFEVTQYQYEKVIGKNPSFFKNYMCENLHDEKLIVQKNNNTSNHPVEQVSWEDAVRFCERLSELPEEKKAGRKYRLPTEAEWEYACRAGSKTAYSFGDMAYSAFVPGLNFGYSWIDEYAWYSEAFHIFHPGGISCGNSDNQTHPVGRKKPNGWGLYDMHGNVWEWFSDWYGDYPKEAVTDPVGPKEGLGRIIRGGSWVSEPWYCRSANRGVLHPEIQCRSYGFRVALNA